MDTFTFWTDKKERILLVDDEPDVLRLFQQILEIKGYSVITAINGKDGLEAAKKHRPDLICMDIQMPRMEGPKVLEELKKDSKTCDIPVIAVTGYASAADKEAFLSLGFTDYISKPIDVDGFVAKVEHNLRKSAP